VERAGAGPEPQDDFATTTRFHLVSRYADAVAVLKDASTFSSALTAGGDGPRLLSELDPPDHGRVRRPMLNALGRRTVDGIAPFVRSQCRTIIDAWSRHGHLDLVEQLAMPVLHRTIAALVGIPDEDRDEVFGWAADLTHNPFDNAQAALRPLDAYLEKMLSALEAGSVLECLNVVFDGFAFGAASADCR
jgi:cytochrome P450